VGGRRVEVPAHTSTGQIRLAAHVNHSRVLARSVAGRNHIVSGNIDVHDGDTFVVGHSFTKGRRPYATYDQELAKVQGALLEKAQEER
jgi:hypothetical protein